MDVTARYIFFAFRLLLALLMLCCISPTPEAPAGKPPDIASLLSSINGETRIIIWKSNYALTLYRGGTPVKTYRAVFGVGHQDGDKRMMGDKRTPEGDFYICTMNHSKRFYKFMGLSYPGLKHAEYGLQANMISSEEFSLIRKAILERQQPPWETRLGGAIGIHGRMLEDGAGVMQSRGMNWTDGCIALANADVDEIFSVVSIGTPVTIRP